MPRCQARLSRGGYCTKSAVSDKEKYCYMHAYKGIHGQELEKFEAVDKFWNEAIEQLITEMPDATLSQIFDYIEFCCAEEENIIVSRRWITQWYKNTQREDHPVEIVALGQKYGSAIRDYPYRKIMEEGLPKTSEEKVLDFLRKNDSATRDQVSKATGVSPNTVTNIAKRFGIELKDGRQVKEKLEIPIITKTHFETFKLLESGLNIQQISNQRDIKLATVCNHIAKLANLGLVWNLDSLVEGVSNSYIREFCDTANHRFYVEYHTGYWHGNEVDAERKQTKFAQSSEFRRLKNDDTFQKFITPYLEHEKNYREIIHRNYDFNRSVPDGSYYALEAIRKRLLNSSLVNNTNLAFYQEILVILESEDLALTKVEKLREMQIPSKYLNRFCDTKEVIKLNNKHNNNKIQAKPSLKVEKAPSPVKMKFTEQDLSRISENLVTVEEMLEKYAISDKITPLQKEVFLTLIKKDGNIYQTAKSLDRDRKGIKNILQALSRKTIKFRDTIDRIKTGQQSLVTVSEMKTSSLHSPSKNEIHGDKFKLNEYIRLDDLIAVIRVSDLVRISKFVTFEYLSKYGYRLPSKTEFTYLIKERFPEIFRFYQKLYGKEAPEKVQFFRPIKPPKYSLNFINKYYSDFSRNNNNFGLIEDQFIFESLSKLKTEIYAAKAKEFFNPREEGIYKEQFLAAEGFIKEKVLEFKEDNEELHFCSECGHIGEKEVINVITSRGNSCVPCNRPVSFLSTRILSLKKESTDPLRKECPKCGKKAEGQKEVEEKFGFRNIGKKTIPQSWCRGCR